MTGERISPAAVILLSFSLLLFLSSGYAGEGLPSGQTAQTELPHTVAVLPFQNETQDAEIAQQVRKTFYNHFSSKPYLDVELMVIDQKVVYLERSSGKEIFSHSPQEICTIIGCDGLVYGRVTEYTKAYAALYSQLAVEAEVWMINVKTGKEVFRVKDAVRYHGGSIPLSPLSIVMTAFSAAMNMREIQQVRMINELCYKLNEKIPVPEGITAIPQPVIKEVLTNVREGPFGRGRVIKVGMEGDKGLIATFDIGNFKKGIPMKEKEPGIYTGEYHVLPGDNTKDMPILVSLKRPGGQETEWIDPGGVVTIDTTPPPVVLGLKAKDFMDRIEVFWNPVRNTPDLKGYRVLRSEQPLSGYKEVASLELTNFEDKTVRPEVVYYYRVIAIDSAGNESDPQDGVKAILTTGKPIMLTGELTKDRTLAGSYVVKDDFVVPRGITLTVEEGTNLSFEEAASLVVRGTLIAERKEAPIDFIPMGENRWKGILIERATIRADNVRIRGAVTALAIHDSEGIIENALLKDNDTGIILSGIPSPVLRSSTVSGNITGVRLERTDAKVIGNNIFQNKEGIQAMAFSGEIKENNIFDNEKNILAEGAIRIGPNFFGTTNIGEMRISGIISPLVYDDRVPQGKVVSSVEDLYVQMDAGERMKKAKELMEEANGYFQKRNFGKASALLEESLKAFPLSESYYCLALCYQEMKEEDKAIQFLRKGIARFPKDTSLLKAYGMALNQKGEEMEARDIFEEVLRINPDDRQVKFIIERMKER